MGDMEESLRTECVATGWRGAADAMDCEPWEMRNETHNTSRR